MKRFEKYYLALAWRKAHSEERGLFFLFWGKDGRCGPNFLVVELEGNSVRYRTFPMPLTLPSESPYIDSFAVNMLVGSLIVTFHFDKRPLLCDY